jgi:SAM-dependent methyltransferase
MLIQITGALRRVVASSPRLRRALWRAWYDYLARGYRQEDWTFMNYGFAERQGPDELGRAGAARVPALALEAADESDRYSIQLYRRVSGGADLRGRDVLEVGSGRGGGCSFIARYLGAASVLGIDYAADAVALSRARHAGVPRLDFQRGDAESLPCRDAAFDAVVNVESSHCYGSMARFLGEVFRVLRPGGYLLWADMRPRGRWDATVRPQFEGAGFHVVSEEDITPGVLLALDRTDGAKRETIRRLVPGFLGPHVEGFAGVRGTRVYEALRSGDVEYRCCALQKPDQPDFRARAQP